MNVYHASQWGIRLGLRLRGVESVTTSVHGFKMHYYRRPGQGMKTPIVLVHGLAGSANGFGRLLTPLASHFQNVIAVDLPGNGFSPLPKNGALGLESQVHVLERFLASVLERPAFLVGNSLGGALSVSLAAQSPQWVSALGLVAPAGGRVSEARWQELQNAFSLRTPADIRNLVARLFHAPPRLLMLFATQMGPMYQSAAVKRILADALDGQRAFLEPHVLAALRMPSLLLWGKSEKLLPYEGLEHFRAHLPAHAHIEEVEGFGHVPQMENPQELASRLVEFAQRHRLD